MKYFCDACDRAFEADSLVCPNCGSEARQATGLTTREFHAALKGAIGQDGEIDDKAHQAATSPKNDLPNPTPAQIERGNYKKGHVTISGFDITIENPEGSQRSGVSHDGKPWAVTLKAHYGYVKRSTGNDGDHVDVFVRPETPADYSGPVFIVYQLDAFGYFDEHKVMLGWPDRDSARDAYFENYALGWPKKRVADIQAMSLIDFRRWLEFPMPLASPEISSDAICEVLVPDDEEVQILAADSGGLCRIRQYATQCDAVNKNRRVYPRPVLSKAIGDARSRARAGAMLSEFEHPAVVDACDRGSCGERFVDDPFAKTARVDDIEAPDSQGKVYITRTILDTPAGREIKRRADRGEPIGISTRFAMTGKTRQVGGQAVFVADSMTIFTFDDVRNPAVEGAGAYTLLTDCELQELATDSQGQPESSPDLGPPFTGENRNTINPPAPAEDLDDELEALLNGDASTTPRLGAQELDTMNKEIQRLLRAFLSKTKVQGASADDLNSANTAVADAIRKAWADGEDVSTYQKAYATVHADAEKISGFVSGREGPYAQLASELGKDPTSGWSAAEFHAGQGEGKHVQQTPVTPKEKQDMMSDEEKERQAYIDAQIKEKKDREAKAARDAAVDDAIKALLAEDSHEINKLDESAREEILKAVRISAPSADSVPTLVDALIAPISKAAADAKLAASGMHGYAAGNTVNNSADPMSGARVTHSPIPVMANVEKLSLAYDEFMRANPGAADEFGWQDPGGPDGKDVKRRREANMAKIQPVLEQSFARLAQARGGFAADSFGEDSLFNDIKRITTGDTAAYNTVVASMYNQPTIAMWLLVQAFQDMRFLEFYQAIGPGQGADGGAQGWEMQQGFGRVFRVPSETYVDPSGYQGTLGMPFDLNVAENSGISPGTVKTYWDTFAANWRKIAATMSLESIMAMGRGPLNYPAVVRNLWHMAARKSRGIDTLLGNEMMNAALEYGAVAVTAEAYTNGGSGGLDTASNSVQPAAGAVTVNLNPAKIASAAVASSDKSVTYGTGNSTGGVAVASALRLQCSGGQGTTGTGTYYSSNAVGPTPVVPPRSQLTLTGPGADSTSTLNPVSISAPVSQVMGYLGKDGNIYSIPGTTATFAVDWLNGVVVFKAGQTTRSGSVFTTAVTITYSYATNFDYFTLGHRNVNQVSLATGETIQAYYNRAVGQLDLSAAAMGQSPNFVKPDLGVMGLGIAARMIQATLWYKLNSPDGTQLYPDETYFARRNGVNLARVNAPCWWSDDAAVMTRNGAGRYAVDTPAEVRGPITLFDSSGNPIAGEGYYLAENSAICTPMVKDISGSVVQTPSRALVFY